MYIYTQIYRDRYRNQYRDQYRNQCRDQYRNQYTQYIYIYISKYKMLRDGCARTEFVVGQSGVKIKTVQQQVYSDGLCGRKKRHENNTCPKKGVLGPNSWRKKRHENDQYPNKLCHI